LKDDLAIWGRCGSINTEFYSAIELFPAASYEYVVYGMGFKAHFESQAYRYKVQNQANPIIQKH
jgi:tryptophan halogenase